MPSLNSAARMMAFVEQCSKSDGRCSAQQAECQEEKVDNKKCKAVNPSGAAAACIRTTPFAIVLGAFTGRAEVREALERVRRPLRPGEAQTLRSGSARDNDTVPYGIPSRVGSGLAPADRCG